MARKHGNKIDGWINIDKPLGMSSFKVVAIVSRILNAKKAGHAGTLDPLASGILPIALGDATKTIEYMQDARKAYEFEVTWGAATTTDDAEGDVTTTSALRPDADAITALLPAFTGEITQTPPRFSAIKIDGQRAYDLARKGEEFTVKSRTVTIDSLTLLATTPDTARFRVDCSKGTYVRSLARDMGEKLGCYGHVTVLRRVKVGKFTEKTAIPLDDLEKIVQSRGVYAPLLPVATALDDIPALAITDSEAQRLRTGQTLLLPSTADITGTAAAFCDGALVALVTIGENGVKPVKVFNLSS